MAQQTIDLTKLNLMQLTQFKNQLDQDLTFYQESLQNLKHAQSKFQDSGDSLGKLTPENKDKEILVPLTGSMYVPGQLSNAEKVLVDVGTGYYVEKDVESAKEYFTKKVKYVTEQMEKVQGIGNEKAKIREAVMDVMEQKLQVQFAQQQSGAKAVK
jgi:prefoldin alpha subunit